MAAAKPEPDICPTCKQPMQEDMAPTGSADAPSSMEAAMPTDTELHADNGDKKKQEECMDTPKKEAAAPMSVEERAELLALRAEKTKRELLIEAEAKISEKKVLLEAAQLASFPKEQWDTILDLADVPPRIFGTTEVQHQPTGTPRRQRESAADVFERALGAAN